MPLPTKVQPKPERMVVPALDQLHSLRTPLTDGERRVLQLLLRQLPAGWEIYIQPHLNGLRPDFVLLHPFVGIAVIEVKDWNFDALSYSVGIGRHGRQQLTAINRAGQTFCPEDPVAKASRYREQIAELYCPGLGCKLNQSPNALATISACLIFPCASGQKARTLMAPLREQCGFVGARTPYLSITGTEELTQQNLRAILPEAFRSGSMWMTPKLAAELRGWLIEPDVSAEQREPLELDERQRDLVSRYVQKPGIYRLRGPAGSGKSQVLAAAAAELSAHGDVLALTYNITLGHYLRDLAVRHRFTGRRVNSGITWTHFHAWCKDMCDLAGLNQEYAALIEAAQTDARAKSVTLETQVPQLTGHALNLLGSHAPRYDAVLVDEGQDFKPEWWNLLRRVCKPEGRMLLTADRTQDLYGRRAAWTEDRMSGCGFTGRWGELKGSYRLPQNMIAYLKTYCRDFLREVEVDAPEAAQQTLDLYPAALRWIQTTPDQAALTCTRVALDMPVQQSELTVHYADISLLASNWCIGLQIADLLAAHIEIIHTFSDSWQDRRAKKLLFYKGDARMKATTPHSYKGWEGRALIVQIDNAASIEARIALYVGLTRLKRHPNGSYLTVVCSAPELESYGKTWPSFERVMGYQQTPVGTVSLRRSAA